MQKHLQRDSLSPQMQASPALFPFMSLRCGAMASLMALFMMALACASPKAKPKPQAAQKPQAAGTEHSLDRPQSYRQLMAGAGSYTNRGDGKRGAELAEKASKIKPDAPEPYALWGRSLAVAGDLVEAAKRYEMALDHGDTRPQTFMELASVYDVSKRYDKALAVYQRYLKITPEDTDARHEMAITLLLLQRFDEAIAEIEHCLKERPGDSQLLTDHGFAYLNKGEPARAEKSLREAVDKAPKNHPAMTFLAQALAAQGRPKEALAYLDKAVEVGRTHARPVRMRARLKMALEDYAGALRDYDLLVRANAKDAGAWLGVAGAQIALGRLDLAQGAVERAKNLVGDHPQVAFRQAQLDWRRQPKAQAASLETIYQVAKDTPTSLEAWREVAILAKALGEKAVLKQAHKTLKAMGENVQAP